MAFNWNTFFQALKLYFDYKKGKDEGDDKVDDRPAPKPPEPAPKPEPKPEPKPSPPPKDKKWKKIIDFGTNDSVGVYEETGNAWVDYKYASSEGGSYRYLSHQGKGLKRVGTAKWTVRSIPYDGTYEIATSFRPSENRTPDADYSVIVNDKVVAKKVINQRGEGGSKKVVLGRFTLKVGDKVSVFLDGTDDNHSDSADASYFELVE